MTPPGLTQNWITGRSSLLPAPRPGEEVRQNFRQGSQALQVREIARDIAVEVARDRFLSAEPRRFTEQLLRGYSQIPREQWDAYWNYFLTHARGGERSSYYKGLSFTLYRIHQAEASETPELFRQFLGLSQEYFNFLNVRSTLSAEEKIRYLFAVSRLSQGVLEELRQRAPEFVPLARQHLLDVYRQILSLEEQRQHPPGNNPDPLAGVIRQVRFQEALLREDRERLRQSALDLGEYYRRHSPPPQGREWTARADRFFARDPQNLQELESFNFPAEAEHQVMALNLLAWNLLAVAAGSLDEFNEEDTEEIRRRYEGLGAVMNTLILANPSATLEQLLERISNPREEGTLVRRLEEARLNNASLSQWIVQVNGGHSLHALVQRAREAALHVKGLIRGPGHELLGIILRGNAHPRRRLDVDPHPWDTFSESLLESLQSRLTEAEDHEIPGLYSIFQLLANPRSLGSDLRFSSATVQQARILLERTHGFEFRARRVASHLTSSSSLLSLGVGILTAELLPAALIARAGAEGSLVIPRIGELVAEGNLTYRGSILTGIGTGAGMSLFGAALHNHERYRHGLSTHFGRDFSTSLLLNSITFGATLPFSRFLQNRLTPAAEDLSILGSSPGWRNWAMHGGTSLFGGTVAYGLNLGARLAMSGEFQSSWEEAVENYGTIFLWEFGAAGFRWGLARWKPNLLLGNYRVGRLRQTTERIILETDPSPPPRTGAGEGEMIPAIGEIPPSAKLTEELEFSLQYRPLSAEEGEGVDFPLRVAPEHHERHWLLGRGDFPGLPVEVQRIIRRLHCVIRIEDNKPVVEDLSWDFERTASAGRPQPSLHLGENYGTWVEFSSRWMRLRQDQSWVLEPGDRIALGRVIRNPYQRTNYEGDEPETRLNNVVPGDHADLSEAVVFSWDLSKVSTSPSDQNGSPPSHDPGTSR